MNGSHGFEHLTTLNLIYKDKIHDICLRAVRWCTELKTINLCIVESPGLVINLDRMFGSNLSQTKEFFKFQHLNITASGIRQDTLHSTLGKRIILNGEYFPQIKSLNFSGCTLEPDVDLCKDLTSIVMTNCELQHRFDEKNNLIAGLDLFKHCDKLESIELNGCCIVSYPQRRLFQIIYDTIESIYYTNLKPSLKNQIRCYVSKFKEIQNLKTIVLIDCEETVGISELMSSSGIALYINCEP